MPPNTAEQYVTRGELNDRLDHFCSTLETTQRSVEKGLDAQQRLSEQFAAVRVQINTLEVKFKGSEEREQAAQASGLERRRVGAMVVVGLMGWGGVAATIAWQAVQWLAGRR